MPPKVVDLLQAGAKKTGSKFLTVIATHAAADPFGKVKKMIKDLIVKLMEEANAEADHKGFCDTEMATNKQTRDIKSSEVEELSGTIDKNTAQSGDRGHTERPHPQKSDLIISDNSTCSEEAQLCVY